MNFGGKKNRRINIGRGTRAMRKNLITEEWPGGNRTAKRTWKNGKPKYK